ncbi:hypothetical protein C8Q76DRAFT_739289 [Earliella scabrosa]|nr:hypothetical protein C8Q76DRAFT_739289 [Earliella scabrosa]
MHTLPEHVVDRLAGIVQNTPAAPYPVARHGSVFEPLPAPIRRQLRRPPGRQLARQNAFCRPSPGPRPQHLADLFRAKVPGFPDPVYDDDDAYPDANLPLSEQDGYVDEFEVLSAVVDSPAPAPLRTTTSTPNAPLRRGAGIPQPPEFFQSTDGSASASVNPGAVTPPITPPASPPPNSRANGRPQIHPSRALRRQGAVILNRATGLPYNEPVQPAPPTAPTAAAAETAKRAANIRALSKTPSLNGLRSLTAPRKGAPLAFQRPQSSVAGPSAPYHVDTKGKGRAIALEQLPEEMTARAADKGKKRAREPEDDSEGDMDEVEASLVIEDGEGEGAADAEAGVAFGPLDGFPPGWPWNYVCKQGLLNVKVTSVPASHLPCARKRTRTETETEDAQGALVDERDFDEVVPKVNVKKRRVDYYSC